MSDTPARRLEIALDLFDLAVEMLEAKIRREHPDLSNADVAKRVAAWCRTRPGAEHGDAEGVPIPWPPPAGSQPTGR